MLEPAPWSLPDEEDRQVAELIRVIGETWASLRSAPHGIPILPAVREAVEKLRQHVRQPYSPEQVRQVLEHGDVSRLHAGLLAKLAAAEGGMELSDALELGGRPRLKLADLGELISWKVYETLVGQEMELLEGLRPEPGLPIAFVGSGPLPLSALLLHLRLGCPVTCVDSDPEACDASRRLIGRLGLEEGIRVVREEGAFFDYAPYSAVFVASLVTGKAGVLGRIRSTRPDAVLAVRTAEGMRRLMYESVDEAALAAGGWVLLGRTHPAERVVINSTLFCRNSACRQV